MSAAVMHLHSAPQWPHTAYRSQTLADLAESIHGANVIGRLLLADAAIAEQGGAPLNPHQSAGLRHALVALLADMERTIESLERYTLSPPAAEENDQ